MKFRNPATKISYYQTPETFKLDRKDHIWVQEVTLDEPRAELEASVTRFKCCLCGAVTPSIPPPYPTDADWSPATYERLTIHDRLACPFPG